MNGKTVFAFVAGTIIGAVGAWVYFNKKYFSGSTEPVEEEQVDLRSKITRQPKKEAVNEETAADTDETDRVNYHKAVQQYTEEAKEEKGPHIIDEEEYADGAVDFNVTWSYFEDGVVTDENDQIVEDVDEAIGEDFVNHFGDTDTCYIRNEARHCDYEILREGCSYYETPKEE